MGMQNGKEEMSRDTGEMPWEKADLHKGQRRKCPGTMQYRNLLP